MTLKDLRMRKSLTQSALAKAVGVKRTTVSMWEAGASLPRLGTLFALSKALECDQQEIIDSLNYEERNLD
jgi:transcriptional regulator with XRE-family HTH domain